MDREIEPKETWRQRYDELASGQTSDGQRFVLSRPRDAADPLRNWVMVEVGNHFQMPVPCVVVEKAGDGLQDGADKMAAVMTGLDYTPPPELEVLEDMYEEPPILPTLYELAGGAEEYRTIVTDLLNREAS